MAAAIGAGLVLGNAPSLSRLLSLTDTLELGDDVRGWKWRELAKIDEAAGGAPARTVCPSLRRGRVLT